MNIRYQLSEAELIELFMVRSGRTGRYLRVFGCVLIAAGIYQFFSPTGNWYMGFGAIAGGALWVFYLPYSARVWVRDDLRLRDEFQADITDDGMKVEGPSASTDYRWSAFRDFRETKNLFLLYQSATIINPIPKRAFTVEEQQTFRVLAASKIPPHIGKARSGWLQMIFWIVGLIAVALLYYGRQKMR